MASEDGKPPYPQQENLVFVDLLDSVIVDVATEYHRAARLGFDHRLNVEEDEELRLSVEARAMVGDPSSSGNGETNSKYTVDIFGQTHPAVASEVFECMNCGRSIVAGRFAPHLEKCMGKGRKARLKATRSNTSLHQRRTRTNPIPVYSTSLGSGAAYTMNRAPHRTSTTTGEDFPKTGNDFTEATS